MLKILKEVCGGDYLTFELSRNLLEVERKYFKSNRRHGLKEEFEKVFKKSFFKDSADALSYAREKKNIQTTNTAKHSDQKFNIEDIKDLNGRLVSSTEL